MHIKPQIDYVTEDKVVFEDGTVLDNVDIILFATGYLPDYDIVDIPGITGESSALNQNLTSDCNRQTVFSKSVPSKYPSTQISSLLTTYVVSVKLMFPVISVCSQGEITISQYAGNTSHDILGQPSPPTPQGKDDQVGSLLLSARTNQEGPCIKEGPQPKTPSPIPYPARRRNRDGGNGQYALYKILGKIGG